MSLRFEGTPALGTPVEIPDGPVRDRFGIAADLQQGQRGLVIGPPETACVITGTDAELRLFALRLLAVTMTPPQGGRMLPESHPEIQVNDPATPPADVIERLLDEAEAAGTFKGWSAISDHGDVAAVEVDDAPFGKFLVTCVPVRRPQ
jgi:hypothetical protein